jgi:hypothetical protein
MAMTTLTLTGRYAGTNRPHRGLFSFIRSRWAEYRLMRSMESVPYAVMKDIGFPAAEREHDM